MGGPVTLGDLIEARKLLWGYCCDCGHERDVCRRRGVAKQCVRGKKVPRIQNVRSIHQLQLPPLRSGRRIDTATAPGGTGERW